MTDHEKQLVEYSKTPEFWSGLAASTRKQAEYYDRIAACLASGATDEALRLVHENNAYVAEVYKTVAGPMAAALSQVEGEWP